MKAVSPELVRAPAEIDRRSGREILQGDTAEISHDLQCRGVPVDDGPKSRQNSRASSVFRAARRET